MMKLTIGLRVSLDGESGSSAEKARDDREEAYLRWMLILMIGLMLILVIGLMVMVNDSYWACLLLLR